MATEPGAMPASAPAAMPIIASSDRSLDIVPYCHYLFSQELDKFMAVFPCEFPQGDRYTEEAFLRQFFSEDEIQVQGGTEGEGYRFLKQAWLWAAHWNLNRRVPALASWWVEHNQSILNDPDMKKRIFEPNVQPSTFFESKEIAMYGDKLLKIVIKHIQYMLHHPDMHLNASSVSDTIAAGEPASTATPHLNVNGTIKRKKDKLGETQSHLEVKHPNNVRSEAESFQEGAQTLREYKYAHDNGKATRQHNDNTGHSVDNFRGGHNTRGSNALALHSGNGSRGARLAGTPIYAPQDARYQSPMMQASHTDPMLAGAMPPKPRTVSAGAYLPGQVEQMPFAISDPQYEGQTGPMQSMTGLPTPYGYSVNGNFQVQMQQNLPSPLGFPPGFAPHHPQPFGDRSNFPDDGRKFGDKSRLYDPDGKSKQPKQGSGGGSVRVYKQRGQPHIQRGGNRGSYIPFGQNGGNFSKDGRTFHNYPGNNDFHFPMGADQVLHGQQQFSMQQRDNHWQLPYSGDGNAMVAQMHATDGIFHSAPNTGSGATPSNESGVVPPLNAQHPSKGYSHQRGLSKSMPCPPAECNKYNIGEECHYARKLVIFQVPLTMTAEAFKKHFSSFGTVENVYLSEELEESSLRPGLLQRCLSWVCFVHASSARQALLQRGKPWDGGPMLFAEVAGEYWNPENRIYQVHLATHGRPSAFAAAAFSQFPNATDGAPRKESRTNNENFMPKKRYSGSNNKKPKKFKKSTTTDENLDGEVKGNATGQKAQSQRTTPIGDIPKLLPGSAAPALEDSVCEDLITNSTANQVAKNEVSKIETFERTTSPTEAVKRDDVGEVVNLDVNQSGGLAIPSAVGDVTESPPTEKEPEPFNAAPTASKPADRTDEAAAEPTSEQVVEATVKPSDDQVDDSFHTADGQYGKENTLTSVQSSAGSATCQAASVPETRPEQKTWAETATGASVKNPESPSDGLALSSDGIELVPGIRSDLTAASECPKDCQSTVPAVHQVGHVVKEDLGATVSGQSMITTVPALDSDTVSVDEKESTAQARSVSIASVSGAPAPGIVAASGALSLPKPNMQVKSQKALKSKGPAQTESLSLFAKPKSRKSSSKKPKHSMEPPSRPGSVNTARIIPQEISPAVPHIEEAVEEAVEGAVEPAAVVELDTTLSASKEIDSSASSESSQEPSLAKTWSVTNLVEPVRAFLSMSSTSQDVKSPPVDHLPRTPVDGEHAIFQPDEVEPGGPQPQESQSDNGVAAGLGISEGTPFSSSATDRTLSPEAEECKPKKKAKSKSKSKKSKTMAMADVTIAGNALSNTKPVEPLHEFRGNDATSDSSSQTLGRTSPTNSRPSMKRIDEAKQPKALLEPRLARQNRSKKHSSIHGIAHSSKLDGSKPDGSKSDRTDDVEDVEDVVTETPKVTLIFPWVDGGYMVSRESGLVFQWSNNNEQQAEEEAEQKLDISDQLVLMPTATPEMSTSVSKQSPTPERPWEKLDIADSDTLSAEAAKSQENLRQLTLEEAAQKRKFA